MSFYQSNFGLNFLANNKLIVTAVAITFHAWKDDA